MYKQGCLSKPPYTRPRRIPVQQVQAPSLTHDTNGQSPGGSTSHSERRKAGVGGETTPITCVESGPQIVVCTTIPSQPNVDQVDIEGPAAPQGGNNQSTNVATCPPRVQLSSE